MSIKTALPLVAGAAALLAMMLTATSPAQAAPHRKVYVGCAARSGDPTPRIAPSSCDTWFSSLSRAETFGSLTNLRWKSWGGRVATATGTKIYGAPGTRTPVTVKLWKPRNVFSMVAYSRLTVHDLKYGTTGTIEMPWGYGLWPLL